MGRTQVVFEAVLVNEQRNVIVVFKLESLPTQLRLWNRGHSR